MKRASLDKARHLIGWYRSLSSLRSGIPKPRHRPGLFSAQTGQSRVRLSPALGVAAHDDGAEPPLILRRSQKRADHAAIVTRLTVVQHIQPEVITGRIRVAPQ